MTEQDHDRTADFKRRTAEQAEAEATEAARLNREQHENPDPPIDDWFRAQTLARTKRKRARAARFARRAR